MIERTEWWRNDRFGMFIHWGPYAVAARGEWVKSDEKMTTKDYQKYVDAFVPSNYNPKTWAKLAKNAGMKYAVMTAKHHDGYCMFDSELTDYKFPEYNNGRDAIREYLEAFREEGLKTGLYYSLIDWHHPDYPNVGNHPMTGIQNWAKGKKFKWENYLEYMHGQIEELMTNYGKIDILWLDFSFESYVGEKWKASELISMIRKHQPDIIINNRLTYNTGLSEGAKNFEGYGDFETPEQGVPEKGLVDGYGNPIPWETCLTLNNNWGYSSTDNEWKTDDLLIQTLVNCVSKNGNLLLNIGPDAQGTVPDEAEKELMEMGEWLAVHGESIYGCGKSSIKKPEWGYFTSKDELLYIHWIQPTIGHINIKSLDASKVREVTILTTGKSAATATEWWGNRDPGNFFINLEEPTFKTYRLPDRRNTVLKVTMNKKE